MSDSLIPSPQALTDARTSRATALVGVLTPGAGAQGMAAPGLLRATGPDAARFLHSQLTNEVVALGEGEGNLSARVARTGHLEHALSVHRLPGAVPDLLLLTEATHAAALHADLDGFLFSDDLVLAVAPPRAWVAVQGPRAAEVTEAVFGPLGFEPWGTLPEGAVRVLRRTRAGVAPGAESWAIRRSLGGDVGFLLSLPAGDPAYNAIVAALGDAARQLGGDAVDADRFSAALEVLRVEAGVARVGLETGAKRRLLPETGLEQSAVSYSKGCYLGQEVIARVRTYGSVPFLLRGLVLTGPPEALDVLPPPGADLVVAGKTIGAIASRTWSVVREAPIAMAFLDRAHRTPGLSLTLDGPHGPWTATVALLPIYAAPDARGRVQALYDLAIRAYADGDADGAMTRLEAALCLDPTFGDAYEAIGVILGKAGRYHEAIDFFRRLEEVAPDEPMVNTNLSLYFMKIGDKQTAEDEGGKATLKGMARTRGKGAAQMDQEMEEGRRKDAVRKRDMFRRVLQIDEADAIALFGLGSACLVLGEAAEAAKHLARAVEVDKNNSAVYVPLGKALEQLDRVDEAVATYRAGMEVASRKGDLMPLKEMEHRLLLLGKSRVA